MAHIISRHGTIRRLCVAVCLFMLTGCANKEMALTECKLDAMKSFGHLRVKNDFGYMAWQHEMEDRSVELCMKTRGFKLDLGEYGLVGPKPNPALITVGTEDRDMWMGKPENWKRDFSVYLP